MSAILKIEFPNEQKLDRIITVVYRLTMFPNIRQIHFIPT